MRTLAWWLLSVAMAGLTAVACAASLEVIRADFPVNQSIVGRRDHATVATNRAGVSLVVWHDYGEPDGDASAALGRFFDSSGLPLSGEFIVNEAFAGEQRVPAVATDGDERFVVAWNSVPPPGGDIVLARLYSAGGLPLSGEIQISSAASESKIHPDVAMFANGEFVVLWNHTMGNSITYYASHYDRDGSRIRGPVRLNQFGSDGPPDPSGQYGLPETAADDAGTAVAVWERISGDLTSIAGRRFNPYTLSASREGLIDPPPAGKRQRRPMVDTNAQADVVVNWAEETLGQTDPDVYVKKYSGASGTWGGTIRPHDSTAGFQSHSTVKLAEDGSFVVAWSGDDDVFMRFYDAGGLPISGEIRVNASSGGAQRRPAIDWAEFADHLLMFVTWEEILPSGATTIFGKLYRVGTIP